MTTRYALLAGLFILIFSASVCSAQPGIISTVAGNGTPGWTGDGGLATIAELNGPNGVAVDASGNVFIDDYVNNRIRKLSTAGIITTYAGNGLGGYGGDGGPATGARLNQPTNIAVDGSGNLFIADGNNNRIRKVDVSGIISTVAGTGAPGFGGDGGPATLATLSGAYGIAVDIAGNLFIGDYNNQRIRKVNTTGIISTIAGTGTAGFSGDGGAATLAKLNNPYELAVDASDNVYITDRNNQRIRMINGAGIISTVAGIGVIGYSGDGAAATLAKINDPVGVTVDGTGSIYISDHHNNVIRKVNTSGIISTIAGNGTPAFGGDGGPPLLAELHWPCGVALDGLGNYYIADYSNSRVRYVSGSDHPPVFAEGSSATLVICENAVATSINSLLAVRDSDVGQTETWSLLLPPLHGTAIVAYTTTSTGGLLTPTGLTYTPTTGYSGFDSFKVTVNDGFASDTITIYLTIDPLPNAGIITGPTLLCIGGTMTLADTATGGAWSASNGHASITPGGVVTGISAGTDTIRYTVSNDCGTLAATYTITVSNALPDPGSISGPAQVCAGSTVTLTDVAAGGVWSSGNTAIATVSATGVVTGVVTDTVTIFYSVTNGCGTATATHLVSVNPTPNVSIISGARNMCVGSIITLSDATAGGVWTSSIPTVASVGSSTGIVTALATGTTTITYSVTNSFGCLGKATIPVTVASSGSFVVTPAITQIKCNNDNNGGISVSITDGTGPYEYTWSNGGSSSAIANLTAGSYSLQVKDLGTGCPETVTYTIVNPDPINVSANIENDNCNKGDGAISLSVTGGTSPYTYKWSFSATSDIVTELQPGSYSVTVKDGNDCSASFTAVVAEDSCHNLIIHDVITPNGDGFNDVWVLEGIQSFPGNSVKVFDKWGDMIYSAENYNNNWGGKGNGGELVPDGTYFYLVKLPGSATVNGQNEFTGSLLVKR